MKSFFCGKAGSPGNACAPGRDGSREVTGGGLYYPVKVVFDRRTGLLAVADTASHRVIIADRHGAVKKVIGSGRPGREDGSFADAGFSSPRGMAFFRGGLYVADTGNHLIREIDFALEEVITAAGNGDRGFPPGGWGPPLVTPLNSPWDLAAEGDKIYVAMAGSHQVWKFDPSGGQIGAFAGSGAEGLRDGGLSDSLFSRPSGLAADQSGSLYCADSGSGSIRRLDLHSGRVETLDLPASPADGGSPAPLRQVRLRQPLGVACDCRAGKIFVADSFNHRVVELDPVVKTSRLYAGGFSRPGGLTVFDSGLLVADTNNHRIVKVAGEVVEEFPLAWPDSECPANHFRRYAPGCGPVTPDPAPTSHCH